MAYVTRSNSRKNALENEIPNRTRHGFGATGEEKGTRAQLPFAVRADRPRSCRCTTNSDAPAHFDEYHSVEACTVKNYAVGNRANFVFVMLSVSLALCPCSLVVLNWGFFLRSVLPLTSRLHRYWMWVRIQFTLGEGVSWVSRHTLGAMWRR